MEEEIKEQQEVKEQHVAKEEKKTISLQIPSIRGKDKYSTAENYSILFIFVGAIILSAGIGLTIISPVGIFAILAMIGSFVAFVFTVILILVWLSKEIFGSE
jgi:hypothetical protein